MDHFKNPRNMGEMKDADAIGEEGNPVCGDLMDIYIKVEDNIITDIKFKTFGCGSAVATSSMITERVDVLLVIGMISIERMRAMMCRTIQMNRQP